MKKLSELPLHQPSCLCVGAANLDTRVQLSAPSRDEVSNPATITAMAGGAALNTARILAMQGIATTFAGPVGNDENGRIVKEALQESGIDCRIDWSDNWTTGSYVSVLEPDGKLKIACNDMKIHDKFDNMDGLVSSELLGPMKAVFCDANLAEKEIHQLIDRSGHTLCAAATVSPAKACRLASVLDRLDIVFTNRADASALLASKSPLRSTADLARQLAENGCNSGVVSDGKDPAWFWHDGKIDFIAVPPVDNVVDVTGAGDGLAGGTLAALLGGQPFETAVARGIAMAAIVLRVAGPYPGNNFNASVQEG